MIKHSETVRAIVIKRINTGEADKIITVFTRQLGKIGLRADGVRRIRSHRAPHIELFNEVSLVLRHNPGIPRITEAQIIQPFSNFRRQIELVGLVFYTAEIIDRLLPEKEVNIFLYDRLLTTLQEINKLAVEKISADEKEKSAERIVKEFVVQLLWEQGYLPRGQYPKIGVTNFVEEIIERRVGSKKFLEQI